MHGRPKVAMPVSTTVTLICLSELYPWQTFRESLEGEGGVEGSDCGRGVRIFLADF